MTPKEANQIKELLEKEFNAEVQLMKSPEDRYEFGVISEQFSTLSHLKRQDRIWEAIDKAVEAQKLSREAMLEISLILAYAPDELHQQA